MRGMMRLALLGVPGAQGGVAGTLTYTETLAQTYSATEIWPLVDIESGTVIPAVVDAARSGTLTGWTPQSFASPATADTLKAPTSDGTGDYGDILTDGLKAAFNGAEGSCSLWIRQSVWNDATWRTALRLELNSNNFIAITKYTTGTMHVYYNAGGTIKSITTIPASSLWAHIGVSWSKSADEFKVFCNGSQIGTTQTSLGTWGAGALAKALLGAETVTPINVWSGGLAYAAVKFGSVWTPTEFANMYAAADSFHPDNAAATNAAAYLTTPTYDGSNEVIHPDVYYNAAGWPDAGGHPYWMGVVPYPDEDDDYENPSILCSDDGTTWSVPVGLTNPLYPMPETGTYSDPDIFVSTDNKLWIVYRWSDDPANTADKLYVQSSEDGVTWTAQVEILSGAFEALASPAVIYDGTQYVLYVKNNNRYTAPAPDGPWTQTTDFTLQRSGGAPPGIWHIDVILHGELYYMIISQLPGHALWCALSYDGVNFDIANAAFLDASVDGWDYLDTYRSSLVPVGDSLHLYYSGRGDDGWRVGLTTVTGLP